MKLYREVKASEATNRANRKPNETMELSDVFGLVEIYDRYSARIMFVEPFEISENSLDLVLTQHFHDASTETIISANKAIQSLLT